MIWNFATTPDEIVQGQQTFFWGGGDFTKKNKAFYFNLLFGYCLGRKTRQKCSRGVLLVNSSRGSRFNKIAMFVSLAVGGARGLN